LSQQKIVKISAFCALNDFSLFSADRFALQGERTVKNLAVPASYAMARGCIPTRFPDFKAKPQSRQKARLIDKSKNPVTSVTLLIINDLARNTNSYRPVTCNGFLLPQ
jgi:hypothetical protein